MTAPVVTDSSFKSFFTKSSRSNATFNPESPTQSSRGSFFARAVGIFRRKRAKEPEDSGLTPSSIADDIDETADEKVVRLEKELQNMRRYAAESDAKCKQLQRMQKTLDNEVQDLTESLFQEAYKMANTAEARREQAEKLLNEALLKVDLLQAEVKALKEIVKSPAKRVLRDKNYKKEAPKALKSAFKSKGSASIPANLDATGNVTEVPDFDPIYFSEFSEWRRLTSGSAGQVPDESETKFMQRTLAEDIQPCLTFTNKALAAEVLEAIKTNTLEVEPLSGNDDPHELKLCGLMEVAKECPYRLRTNGDAQWVFVSLSARNRIMAVCDFFTYLRYLRFGIVKAELEDAFLDIAAMRRNMALARFGFDFTAKMTGSGLTN
uniref:Sec2p domain-containing protein n=1 Tax=Panagrellus redivivus TaxID=6233 RepID=A0A7E4V874_PANRE